MAKNFHRKLFFNQTSTPTNETYRCTDFCDPTCGNLEECYTFPGPVEPLPPLPPPVPPISIVVSPSTTNQGIIQVSPFVIIVVIILASIFLLVSYYAIVIKYCTFWNRFIIRRDHDASPQSVQGDGHATDALIREDDDQDPVIDHPIWLISTIGLHQSVINSITMVKYKSEDGLIDGTDCSVCLSEFQEGETLRLLPKCKHAFHIDCIDTWLRSHTNCPLCRAAIMANSARQSLASNNPSFGHSRRVDLGQILDSDSSDIELDNIRIGESGRVVEIRGDDNVDRNDQNKADNDDYNIIRRSFSMDHFRGLNSSNVGDSNLLRNSSNSSSTRVMDSSSSSGPQPPRSMPLMKRSYSWSERVFWSSSNQNSCNRNIYP